MRKATYKILSHTKRLIFFLKNLFLCNLFSKSYWRSRINNPVCFQKLIIRGKGTVFIDNNVTFGYKLGGRHYKSVCELQPRYENSVIRINKFVATNNNLFICCANNVVIGEYTLIGENVTIMDFEAHGINMLERRKVGEIGSVSIGNNVWIGNNVVILKNTKIGDNTIVAANAVVAGSFPENVIIGGVPARIIKSIQ